MTDHTVQAMSGLRVLVCDPAGSTLHVNDVISEAWSVEADLIALPLSRLSQDFLDLKTGVAGEMIQKFVNYQLRLALVGDVAAAAAKSGALRDFIYESNRGQAVWFVETLDDLAVKLATVANSR
jgi:hypothetical protein